MLEFILYDPSKVTESDCVFYLIKSKLGLCVHENELCFSYEKAGCHTNPKDAFVFLNILHELKLFRFHDSNNISSLIENTWPWGFKVLEDFQDAYLGVFNLRSSLDTEFSTKLGYTKMSLKCVSEWPEYLLDAGDFIEDYMTSFNFDGFSFILNPPKEYTACRATLNSLLYIFLYNEIHRSADIVLASGEFCVQVSNDLKFGLGLDLNLVIKEIEVTPNKIVHSNNFPDIDEIINNLKQNYSRNNLIKANQDLKYGIVEHYGSFGNYRLFDLVIEFEQPMNYEDALQSLKTYLLNLSKYYEDSYISLGGTTKGVSPVDVAMSSLIEVLSFKEIDLKNSYEAQVTFTIFIN